MQSHLPHLPRAGAEPAEQAVQELKTNAAEAFAAPVGKKQVRLMDSMHD